MFESSLNSLTKFNEYLFIFIEFQTNRRISFSPYALELHRTNDGNRKDNMRVRNEFS